MRAIDKLVALHSYTLGNYVEGFFFPSTFFFHYWTRWVLESRERANLTCKTVDSTPSARILVHHECFNFKRYAINASLNEVQSLPLPLLKKLKSTQYEASNCEARGYKLRYVVGGRKLLNAIRFYKENTFGSKFLNFAGDRLLHVQERCPSN